MRLIGAGLFRTGTRSLKDALEILGYDATYHMTDLFEDVSRIRHWYDAAEGRPVEWAALFEGYAAVVDFPAAGVWRRLVEDFPQAKVLLTLRDAEDWYESVLCTVYESRGRTGTPIDSYAERHIWQGFLEGRFLDRAWAIQRFHQHVAEVREAVPDRLVELEVGGGWGPLCEGLGLEVPEVPYPNRNGRREFIERMRVQRAQENL